MRSLADNGGSVLVEDGTRLMFLRRRILPTWVGFVCAVVAVTAGGNGVVQLVVGHAVAGSCLLALSAGAALGLGAARRSRRRAKAEPLDPAAALLVLDVRAGTLLDGAGRILAPLAAVRIERSMQVTSSARALRIAWPDGAMVVYRGDALQPGGSIDVPVEALRSRGLTLSA